MSCLLGQFCLLYNCPFSQCCCLGQGRSKGGYGLLDSPKALHNLGVDLLLVLVLLQHLFRSNAACGASGVCLFVIAHHLSSSYRYLKTSQLPFRKEAA